jgi:hypothetical protein
MTEVSDRALAALQRARVVLDAGLTEPEFSRIRDQLGVEFGSDHRDLLASAVPVGDRFPDWRGDVAALRPILEWPVDGVLVDVESSDFWPAGWGPRPPDAAERERVVRARLELAPALVPVYSHRYALGAPAPSGSPVFSVHQTDVIVYGGDLADYVGREFLGDTALLGRPGADVPFWGELAYGAL